MGRERERGERESQRERERERERERAAVFKAHEHELGCSKCFQSRIWEQASDWLNSVVDGGEETQKRVDQLGFASNGLSNPSSFTLYIGL